MNIHINLKLLALLTIVFSLIIFTMAFVYSVPVAYVPEEATLTEYIVMHVIFISSEVAILSFLFMHMIKKSKLNFYGDISKIFT